MALKDSAAPLGTLGNYDLVQKLGEGSMGTVYKACHWTTRQVVAIKVMPATVARKPMLLKRFEQEFRIASRVHHPNVVRVLEYSGRGTEPYLVMEFVDGVALGTRLEREGRLQEGEAVGLITQVAEGLHHAHQRGLLHRDVKPDNVLVTAEGVAKLTDLGLGKELDAAAELTRTGTGLGTPNFMAPEQFRDAKHADVHCDIYSLAATLYQMLTGELPFGSGDPVRILMRKMSNELTPMRKLVPNLSERVERAILRAMDPEPGRRHGSCLEFVDDLLGRLTGAPTAAPGKGGSLRGLLNRELPEEDLAKTHLRPRASEEKNAGRRRTGAIPRANLDARQARAVNSPSPKAQAAEGLPHTPAPPAVPRFVVPLSSEKYLPPEPSPARRHEPAPPPPARRRQLSDGWKTVLVVLLTGAVTLAISHFLFPFLK
jgi:serine/threonine protein kinase